MKKYIALFVLLLCAAILCSCGNAEDKSKTASEIQKTVTGTNSDEEFSSKTESAPAESGNDASAVSSKTNSNSKSTVATSSASSGSESPSASSTENQTLNNSDESSDPSFVPDEYELPFIPN